jgi:hypothetical protein
MGKIPTVAWINMLQFLSQFQNYGRENIQLLFLILTVLVFKQYQGFAPAVSKAVKLVLQMVRIYYRHVEMVSRKYHFHRFVQAFKFVDGRGSPP